MSLLNPASIEWDLVPVYDVFHGTGMQIEEMGGSALVFGGDMSKEADVDALFKAVSFGPFSFPV